MTPTTAPVPVAPTRGLRSRSTWLVLGAAVVAVVVAVLVASGASRTSAALDPDNPGTAGIKALAEVLDGQGVEVTTARDAAALVDADPGPGTVVVVTTPESLGRSTASELLAQTKDANVVLFAPRHPSLEALGLDETWDDTGPGDVSARCDDPVVGDLTLAVGSAQHYPGPGCFPVDGGVLLAEPREGVWLFGAPEALSNDQITSGDNAALGLRLLGSGDRVVFYVPDPADLSATESTALGDLLPSWLRPVLLLSLVGFGVLLLWRGRRFGPLAVEPLPVVVRAGEAVRARGRLHHRSDDRGHSADALRQAARHQLAAHLRVPATDTAALVAAVTAAGVDAATATHLLSGPAPATDTALTELAGQLADLTRKVVEE